MTDLPASLEVGRAIEEIIRDVRMKEGQRRTLRTLVSEVERLRAKNDWWEGSLGSLNNQYHVLAKDYSEAADALAATQSRLARAEADAWAKGLEAGARFMFEEGRIVQAECIRKLPNPFSPPIKPEA